MWVFCVLIMLLLSLPVPVVQVEDSRAPLSVKKFSLVPVSFLIIFFKTVITRYLLHFSSLFSYPDVSPE